MKDEKYTTAKNCGLRCPICGSEIVAAETKPKGRDKRYKAKCSDCDFIYDCRELTPEAAIEAASRRWDGWISVEDALPDEKEYVLVLGHDTEAEDDTNNAYVIVGRWFHRYDSQYWISNASKYQLEEVTHWQPLPQLPVVEKIVPDKTVILNKEWRDDSPNSNGRSPVLREPLTCSTELVSCEDCIYLSLTEREQDDIYEKTGKKPDHICKKYNTRLLHLGSSRLHPCPHCRSDQVVYINVLEKFLEFVE